MVRAYHLRRVIVELIKKNIHMEQRIKWAASQISLEEDQNISDQKPDAYKIICKSACVKVEETKPVEEAVWIKGCLEYKVLYLTDEKERQMCSMEGKMPFEEKIYTDRNVTGDSLRVHTKVDDLTIRLINSRKMNIRCIIGVEITQDNLYDEEVVMDVENPQMCEILKKPLEVTTVVLDTKDIYRVREELEVPDGLPNIYSIIWKDVRMEGLNFIPMDGKIGISGETNCFFLYEGEEEAIPRCFEVSRPFSGMLDVPECRENTQLRMDYEMEPAHIEVKPDYDGEERQIDVEMELKLYIKLYQNATLAVVADAYGIQEKMEPVMKESHCEKILKKENGKIKVNDSWENKGNPGIEMQILRASGNILEEEVKMMEDSAVLSGILHVDILCAVKEESEPYRCISMDIPYEHSVPVNGASQNCPYYSKICIEQLGAIQQGERMDIRAILTYQLMVYQVVAKPLLIDMNKAETGKEQKELPVMSVYFAKENENIWEVGKKYQVPLVTIRNLNQLAEDTLCDGQKVLIVKETV
jgi:hypothetical protein